MNECGAGATASTSAGASAKEVSGTGGSNKGSKKIYHCRKHHCQMTFSTYAQLKEHRKSHKFEKPYVCDVCGKSFRSNCHLKEHMLFHNDQRDFICDQCPTRCHTVHMLKEHMETHNKEGRRKFVCTVCAAVFKTSAGLWKHKFIHKPDTLKFLCSKCGKQFQNPVQLKRHVATHSEAKFPCQLCPKSFNRRELLRRHSFVHVTEKKLVCDVCHKKYASKSQLAKHRLHHKNLYECGLCRRQFTVMPSLQKHIRNVHDKIKDFSCVVCGYKFSQKTHLKYHLSHVHKLEAPTKSSTASIKTERIQPPGNQEVKREPPQVDENRSILAQLMAEGTSSIPRNLDPYSPSSGAHSAIITMTNATAASSPFVARTGSLEYVSVIPPPRQGSSRSVRKPSTATGPRPVRSYREDARVYSAMPCSIPAQSYQLMMTGPHGVPTTLMLPRMEDVHLYSTQDLYRKSHPALGLTPPSQTVEIATPFSNTDESCVTEILTQLNPATKETYVVTTEDTSPSTLIVYYQESRGAPLMKMQIERSNDCEYEEISNIYEPISD
jgi:hypothetical protein